MRTFRAIATGLLAGCTIIAAACTAASETPSTEDVGSDGTGAPDTGGTPDVASDAGADTSQPADTGFITDTAGDTGEEADTAVTDTSEPDVAEDVGQDVAVPPTTAQLVVHVLDRAGLPVAGATVAGGEASGLTDALGHALLDIPADGETNIIISKEGYANTFRPMTPAGAPSLSFEAILFQPDFTTTINVTDGATVELTVASADIGSLVIPKDGLVDETGAKTDMTARYGWGPKGERVVEAVPHGRWRTTTLLHAIDLAGTRAAMITDGPTDAAVFETFVDWLLAPKLRPGDVVVLDNLGSHKSASARRSSATSRAAAAVRPAECGA